MLSSMLSKSRRPHSVSSHTTATTYVRPLGGQGGQNSSRSSDDILLSDDGSDVSASVVVDKALTAEERSYTIIPKSRDSVADLDQEWTDVGVGGKEKARVRELEERKRMEEEMEERRRIEEERKKIEEERKKIEEGRKVFEEQMKERDRKRNQKELEDMRKLVEERMKVEEQRRALKEQKRAAEVRRWEEEQRKLEEEERRKTEDEERRKKNEEERKRREEEELKRREEDRRKREEAERRLRENYETAARIREDRAREEERKKQESLRAQERQKLEITIQEREEREKALQERLADLEDEQHAGTIQITELMRHSEFLEDQNRLLKDRLDRQSDEFRVLKDQLHDSSNQISRFLAVGAGKSSKSAEQEIVMLLDILNSEIYQAAACIADLLDSRGQVPEKSLIGASAEEGRLTKMLGTGLTEVLKTKPGKSRQVDPLLVQVVLQMCMHHCCEKIIESWCPGMWNHSDFLSTLYAGIRATEDVEAASKWRAVTHAQFKQTDSMKSSMARFLNEHIMAVLTFIGLPYSSTGWITELLEERCPMIVGSALHINSAIFEDRGPDRLEVALVRSEELFDSSKMENTFGRSADTGQFVVATSDLGFRRISGEFNAVAYIVKPKVVLSNTFDADTRRILEQSR